MNQIYVIVVVILHRSLLLFLDTIEIYIRTSSPFCLKRRDRIGKIHTWSKDVDLKSNKRSFTP